MTDKNIINALEYCKSPVGSGDCNKCPLKDVRNKTLTEGEKSCTTIMLENAIDYINRQQAEIERLNKEVKYWEVEAKEARADINQAVAEAEAVKEFAERLHDRIVNFPSVYPIENAILAFLNGSAHRQLEILEIIDNLVKEMVGENNARDIIQR